MAQHENQPVRAPRGGRSLPASYACMHDAEGVPRSPYECGAAAMGSMSETDETESDPEISAWTGRGDRSTDRFAGCLRSEKRT